MFILIFVYGLELLSTKKILISIICLEKQSDDHHLLCPVNIVYLATGTTFSWPSPVLDKLDLTDTEGSRVVSMLSLGSILGPFVSRAVIDVLGRKVNSNVFRLIVLPLSWAPVPYSFVCGLMS